MHNRVIIFVLFVQQLILFSSLWATVQTDTHTYILGHYEDKILVIDRKTGKEKIVKVGKSPRSMVIHDGKGFVVNKASNDISVIDLTTHEVMKTISVGWNPVQFVVHRNVGYVVNMDSHGISVLDLDELRERYQIKVGENPISMTIRNNMAYVINYKARSLSVLALGPSQIIKTINLGCYVRSMIVHGDKGYLVSDTENSLNIVNLQTYEHQVSLGCAMGTSIVIYNERVYFITSNQREILGFDASGDPVYRKITIGNNIHDLVLYKDKIYVLNRDSSTVSVIDLLTHKVTHTIRDVKSPYRMVFNRSLGYIMSSLMNDVTVINLTTHQVIARIQNPGNDKIDFSDTHVYLGLKKVAYLLPLILFDDPYQGIQNLEGCFEDGDQAFNSFIEDVNVKNYKSARRHFEIALATGHPKANAVAALAFLTDKWGACDTPEDAWWQEFTAPMDYTYFFALSRNPFDEVLLSVGDV